MFKLVKGNVQRDVATEAAAQKLEAEGYKILGKKEAPVTDKPYSEMKITELRKIAKDRGYTVSQSLQKDDLIKMLEAEEETEGGAEEETEGDEQ